MALDAIISGDPLPDYRNLASPIGDGGECQATLLIEGMHCATCAWQIENELNRQSSVTARVNLTTNRLSLRWLGEKSRINDLITSASSLGYRFLPTDQIGASDPHRAEERRLLQYVAVAGFGSGNVMLLSLALWFTAPETMGDATRSMLHWLSALVTLPAVIYSGQPFFASAWRAVRARRTNMDVPISVAVILACGMSLWETIRGGPYIYFDSAIMLVFLLLIGRYLDKKARGRARHAAMDLLQMLHGTANVLIDGKIRTMFARDILPGMIIVTGMGERVAADGEIISGHSTMDTSMITGETLPIEAGVGARVFAGTMNISQPVHIRVTSSVEQSVMADIIRLMEQAEQKQSRQIRLADHVARYYTPVVHGLAALAFIGWWGFGGMDWQPALMIATTVLIITCPCALGLAVPAVQVVASHRLFQNGILLKSGDALERLAQIDYVVFDKTGTLTAGQPQLCAPETVDQTILARAASLAAYSRHPLARALAKSWGGAFSKMDAIEIPGTGIQAVQNGKEWKLGRADWVGAPKTEIASNADAQSLELWFTDGVCPPYRFAFADQIRSDAKLTVEALKNSSFAVELLSGDRKIVTQSVAQQLDITLYQAPLSPTEKANYIQYLQQNGHKVLMVGDGLNDAAAISSADVSMSPSSATEITQNAADMVFLGTQLRPVLTAMRIAMTAQKLVKQNLWMSVGYNIFAVPAAMAGMVTPLWAALAMSASSLVVVANAMRLASGREGAASLMDIK